MSVDIHDFAREIGANQVGVLYCDTEPESNRNDAATIVKNILEGSPIPLLIVPNKYRPGEDGFYFAIERVEAK